MYDPKKSLDWPRMFDNSDRVMIKYTANYS
jgi:hypothetical protein